MTFDLWIHYGSLLLAYGSSAVVFYWMAMAWQQRKDFCFFLIALSSGLIVLIGVMDFVAERQQLSDAEYLNYWYCRQMTYIVEAILFPWGIWRLFKYLDSVESLALPVSGLQAPSATPEEGVPLPDRESRIASLPVQKSDSTQILSDDRDH